MSIPQHGNLADHKTWCCFLLPVQIMALTLKAFNVCSICESPLQYGLVHMYIDIDTSLELLRLSLELLEFSSSRFHFQYVDTLHTFLLANLKLSVL